MPGIIEGKTIKEHRTLRPDFCVIGSGAGGGVCALKLAEAGFDVLVLEEGPNTPKGQGHGGDCHVRPTLVEREAKMYRRLYQEGAGRLTADGRIQVLQGRCLGGGTNVNWAACLPPPKRTLDFWNEHFGLPFTRQNLRPYIQEVVNYLNIHRDERYNRSARVMEDGCKKLGYHFDNLPNNTVECRECGSCGTGCPYDRKQGGTVTWLADAVNQKPPGRSATIYTDTRVVRLKIDGGKVREVRARFLDENNEETKFKLEVRPKKGVVLAAGGIGSPAILRRSRFSPNGLAGRWTQIHPITMCFGRYEGKTFPAYGVPDNRISTQFADSPTGYLIETGSFFPVLTSVVSLDMGAQLRRVMKQYYPKGAILYAHHNSGFDLKWRYGTVKLDSNKEPELEYRLHPANQEAMRQSLREMTLIHLRGGAKSVYHITNPAIEIRADRNEEQELKKLDKVSFDPVKTTVMTVHVMGGCRMGKKQFESVVRPDFRLRGTTNAWVVDGSIFPTGLGANPQVTIYSLALWASKIITGRFGGKFKLHCQKKNWPWPEA